MNRIEAYLEDIYSVLGAEPEIEITDWPQFITLNAALNVGFKVNNARGKVSVAITRGAAVAWVRNNVYDRVFNAELSTGVSTSGILNYTISIMDSMGNTAEKTISVTVLDFEFTFDNTSNYAVKYVQNGVLNLSTNKQLILISHGGTESTNHKLHYRINGGNWSLGGVEPNNKAEGEEKYYWNFPLITHTTTTNADEVVLIEFYVEMDVLGSHTATSELPVTCYCLYGDDYRVNVLSSLDGLNAARRTTLEYELVATEEYKNI
jgi:hypothetical protein